MEVIGFMSISKRQSKYKIQHTIYPQYIGVERQHTNLEEHIFLPKM